jgi:hypothetical protein
MCVNVKRKLTFLGILVVLSAIVTVMVRNKRSVLVRMPFGINQETGDHNYVLFNPFRDRSPERAASAYLEAMQRGNCEEAGKLSTNVVLPNGYTCEGLQNDYRKVRHLFVQRLRDRRDEGRVVVLYYSDSGYEGNWVGVRQLGGEWGGTWRVVAFNKIW